VLPSRLDVTVYVNVARSEFAAACPALIAWPPASVAGPTAVLGINPFCWADVRFANDRTATQIDRNTNRCDTDPITINSPLNWIGTAYGRDGDGTLRIIAPIYVEYL